MGLDDSNWCNNCENADVFTYTNSMFVISATEDESQVTVTLDFTVLFTCVMAELTTPLVHSTPFVLWVI